MCVCEYSVMPFPFLLGSIALIKALGLTQMKYLSWKDTFLHLMNFLPFMSLQIEQKKGELN